MQTHHSPQTLTPASPPRARSSSCERRLPSPALGQCCLQIFQHFLIWPLVDLVTRIFGGVVGCSRFRTRKKHFLVRSRHGRRPTPTPNPNPDPNPGTQNGRETRLRCFSTVFASLICGPLNSPRPMRQTPPPPAQDQGSQVVKDYRPFLGKCEVRVRLFYCYFSAPILFFFVCLLAGAWSAVLKARKTPDRCDLFVIRFTVKPAAQATEAIACCAFFARCAP